MSYIKTNIKDFIKESKGVDKLTWEQHTHEIKIPEFKLPDYKKFLTKLKRFSKTIGFPEPISKEKSKEKLYIIYDGNSIYKQTSDIKEAKKIVGTSKNRYINEVVISVFDLTIVDDVKPIEEWEILGTVDYIDSIVKPAPNKEIPMNLLKDITLSGNSNCDHCGKKIYRNKTVFVRNTEDGEIKHIGGTCTKYYLGLDYKKVLEYIESIYTMDSLYTFSEEWGSYGKPFEKDYSVDSILRYYIWHTKHNGHMSKKQAEAYNDKIDTENTTSHTKRSTGSIVSSMVEYVSYPPDTKGLKSWDADDEIEKWTRTCVEFNKNIKTIKDDEVKEILDFVDSKKEESNFMFNVNNKIQEGHIVEKLISYITGACSFFFSIKLHEENQRKKKEKELEANGGLELSHIGVIGEKYGFKVTVTRLSGFEGSFGWTNIYTMVDEKGNVITKFGTIGDRYITNKDESIQIDTTLEFTSDVKDHGEFNGTKQTTIGRLSKYDSKLKY